MPRWVAVVAPPGWGKTRRAARLAALHHGRTLYLARTHEELREAQRFAGGRLAVVAGRERLCPLGLTWRQCAAARRLGVCTYRHEASDELVRLVARGAEPSRVAAEAGRLGYCPYPSIVHAAHKLPKVAATHAFALAHPGVAESRDLIVVDEAQALLDAVVDSIPVLDEATVYALAERLKHEGRREAAYRLRAAWRTAVKRGDPEPLLAALDELGDPGGVVDAWYAGRAAWRAGRLTWLPRGWRNPVDEVLGDRDAVLYGVAPPPVRARLVELRGRAPSIDVTIVDSVTSAYRERGPETYKAYADIIAEHAPLDVASLVVFPSRSFARHVLDMLPESVRRRVRPPEAIREAKPGDIIVDVAGGVATEGVNPSKHLRVVIVAGAPYPEPDPRLDLVTAVLGVDAYTHIAVTRTVQAAGRLRRGGRVVLADKRFRSLSLPEWLT